MEIIPLDDHERPAGPAVNRLEDWYQALRKKIVDQGSEVTVTEDQLSLASIECIRAFSREPDCDFVFQAMDKAYLDRMNDESGDEHLHLLVFPPCDRSNRVASWAEMHGMDILTAPDRSELLSRDRAEVNLPVGQGPLVIPKLEDWFVRHRQGLRHIRALLSALQNTSRSCLVSCSSWTWIYLKKSVNADLVLPAPDSLAPMNADSLGEWLLSLLSEQSDQSITFRDHSDGKELLRRSEDGTFSEDFMAQLADDSAGIPWIAWQLWRRSLRTEAERADQVEESEQEADEADEVDKQQEAESKTTVFWVVRGQPPTLPRGHERAACLVLQALLIHGSLPDEILGSVLPSIGESNLVVALIRSGFIERHDGALRCLATAYPVIWTTLSNSGMTMAHF
ncbi:hypothetical protein ACUNV4_22900 [Granulosicoccus sp. 3-233]|uniref:hypothetical protein n=1 Tax=Granulosicoccus sp. 3-233 TaxID=3417969 RepID=UPI003D356816